jgi:hypothetical protein
MFLQRFPFPRLIVSAFQVLDKDHPPVLDGPPRSTVGRLCGITPSVTPAHFEDNIQPLNITRIAFSIQLVL